LFGALLGLQFSAPAAAQTQAARGPAVGEARAGLGVSAALERAQSFYRAGRYDSCVSAFEEFLKGSEADSEAELTPGLQEQARVYFGACLLANGEESKAERQFRTALEGNPLMPAPDPVLFPSQVRDLFFQVKADFLEAIRKAQEEQLEKARLVAEARARRAQQERERVRQLEVAAATETLISQNRRWVASIPFGVGQFQNGDTLLGGVFLVGEALLFITTVAAVSFELGIHHEAKGGSAVTSENQTDVKNSLQLAHGIELGAGAGFIALAIAGITQAHLAYVPEISVGKRNRPLSESLRQSPADKDTRSNFQAPDQAAWLTWSGRF
jgi:hypothetical protein